MAVWTNKKRILKNFHFLKILLSKRRTFCCIFQPNQRMGSYRSATRFHLYLFFDRTSKLWTSCKMENLLAYLFDILNPETIIRYGGLTLLLIIVFAETGLFFGFFLPGDSLLFIAGLLSDSEYIFHLSLLNSYNNTSPAARRPLQLFWRHSECWYRRVHRFQFRLW